MNPGRQAELLIQEGKPGEAKRVLIQAIQDRPDRPGPYQEAVNVFLYGEMYEEAMQIFGMYQSRTGEKLRGDFSLEEVERLARKSAAKEAKLREELCVYPDKLVIREGVPVVRNPGGDADHRACPDGGAKYFDEKALPEDGEEGDLQAERHRTWRYRRSSQRAGEALQSRTDPESREGMAALAEDLLVGCHGAGNGLVSEGAE